MQAVRFGSGHGWTSTLRSSTATEDGSQPWHAYQENRLSETTRTVHQEMPRTSTNVQQARQPSAPQATSSTSSNLRNVRQLPARQAPFGTSGNAQHVKQPSARRLEVNMTRSREGKSAIRYQYTTSLCLGKRIPEKNLRGGDLRRWTRRNLFVRKGVGVHAALRDQLRVPGTILPDRTAQAGHRRSRRLPRRAPCRCSGVSAHDPWT